MKVVTIVGARPNFIKAALVSLELEKNGIKEFMVHTGQHYDVGLSDQIFNDLKIKTPDLNLGIGSGSHAYQTGKILMEIEKILITQKVVLIPYLKNSLRWHLRLELTQLSPLLKQKIS